MQILENTEDQKRAFPKNTGFENPETVGKRDTIILQKPSSFPWRDQEIYSHSTHNWYLTRIPPRVPLWVRPAPPQESPAGTKLDT